MVNIKTETEQEFKNAISEMAARLNGRDNICNFSWIRYGCAVNNYQGTRTSVMVDEIINFEEKVDEEYRWKADIFYYE